jgi:glycerol transport system substrate-binding protein
MKIRKLAVAVAMTLCASRAFADMKAAEKWVDSEFKPSTPSAATG